VTAGVVLRSFAPARVSLEDVFIQVYGEQHEMAGV
jgi:ABC-2 type transport system ATP-binding protein